MKPKNKRGKKAMVIFAVVIGVIVSLNVIGFLVNTLFFKDELKAIQPYGQMVDINGSKMHVFSLGNGEETIVLLPGWGVALPSADFGPLMRKLSEKYTVVAVEYFGVGFSDAANTPRTNENHTNEIRTALSIAGFTSPYILMPHSASGVYAEYYATKYPEEVSAIIMLDTTSTAAISEAKPPSFIYNIAKLQQSTGLARWLSRIIPGTMRVENGYTKQEEADYRLFSYHAVNDTMIKQSELLMENIKEVNALAFPQDIPVLKIISKQSVDAMAKRDKDDGMGYQKAHLSRLGENVEYVVMDSTHFMYQAKAGEVVELMEDFLANSTK